MNLKSLSIFLILSTMFSCKNAKMVYVAEGKPVVINLDSKAAHASIADYVDSLKVVNLETNENSLISEAWGIQRVFYIENKFYILDGKYMAVKVFDANGKYLYSVGKLGMGKGEFVKLDDLQYYPAHNSVMILCNKPSKISEFTLDGRLIGESKLDFFSTAVGFPSSKTRIHYVNQNKNKKTGNNNLLLTDSSNEVKSSGFDMPINIKSTIKFSGGLFSINDSIYFNPAFSNTYYIFKNDTIKPVFLVNYGLKNIPSDIKEDALLDNLIKYSFQYNSFVKTKDYVGFNYLDNKVSSAFYNLHSGTILTSDTKMDSLNMLFRNLMFTNGNDYIMLLDPRRMADFLKRNAALIGYRFPVLKALINHLAANQNPSLLLFKLKSL